MTLWRTGYLSNTKRFVALQASSSERLPLGHTTRSAASRDPLEIYIPLYYGIFRSAPPSATTAHPRALTARAPPTNQLPSEAILPLPVPLSVIPMYLFDCSYRRRFALWLFVSPCRALSTVSEAIFVVIFRHERLLCSHAFSARVSYGRGIRHHHPCQHRRPIGYHPLKFAMSSCLPMHCLRNSSFNISRAALPLAGWSLLSHSKSGIVRLDRRSSAVELGCSVVGLKGTITFGDLHGPMDHVQYVCGHDLLCSFHLSSCSNADAARGTPQTVESPHTIQCCRALCLRYSSVVFDSSTSARIIVTG